MPIGAALGVVGGIIQGNAAKKAAKAQERAATADLEFQKEVYADTRREVRPWLQGGNTARNALSFELGLGDRPMVGGTAMDVRTVEPTRRGGQPTYLVGDMSFGTEAEAQAYADANRVGAREYEGFQKTPGYEFELSEGLGAVNALAGARGGLNSGRTMQALQERGQGIANQGYNNYLNRLTGMSDTGLSAASLNANAGQSAASGVSNALSGIGNAQSAGAIGVGNAWTGALQNTLGSFNYQRGISGGGGFGNSPIFNPLFGGAGLGNLF